MSREYVNLRTTHEAYWDQDGVIRHRLRRPHAEARRRYHLAIARDAALILLAVFVVVVASATGYPA